MTSRRGARRRARRRALDLLYEADITGTPAPDVLERHRAEGENIDAFTVELLSGVESHKEELDILIGRYSLEWTVARMPAVDRSALRIACYELLREDVSAAVAINEAVEAVKELSTDESSRFLNGVLGRIAREVEEP